MQGDGWLREGRKVAGVDQSAIEPSDLECTERIEAKGVVEDAKDVDTTDERDD